MAPHDRDRESRRRDRRFLTLLAFVPTFAVVAPMTRRGWLVLLDWVPGPRGIGRAGAVAMPTGLVFGAPVEAARHVVGAAVGWLPIAVALALATIGGARLFEGPRAARAVTGIACAWNPWVYDRIAAGQLAVVMGYALLPWLLRAAVRADSRRGAAATGVWWALAAGCSLHFLWIGGVIVAACALTRLRALGLRRVLVGLGVAVAIAGVLTSAAFIGRTDTGRGGDARVLTSFGTAPDPDLGRTLGLLAQQGFWRPATDRPRDDLGVAFPLVAGLVIGVAAVGLARGRHTKHRRLAMATTIAAAAGWLLAHGTAGPVGSWYRLAFDHVPGFAVMREAQKWDALVCVAAAVGLGLFARELSRTRARWVAHVVVALPLALAPTMAWGLAGRVAPVRYPASWTTLRAAVDGTPGSIIALPWERYLLPGFAGDHTITNPAAAYFGPRVRTGDDPHVPGLTADDTPVARAVVAARVAAERGAPLRLGEQLGRLGVRGIVVIGAPPLPLASDPGLELRAEGAGATFWAVKTGPEALRSPDARPMST